MNQDGPTFGKLTAEFQRIDSRGRADIRITQTPYLKPYKALETFIPMACNSHDALLEACKELTRACCDADTEGECPERVTGEMLDRCLAAIRLAEGRKASAQ